MTTTISLRADNPRPSAGELARRLGLKRVGRQFEGPCPFCGGKNRFHAQDQPGKLGVVDCRKCSSSDKDWYPDVLRKAGLLDDEHPVAARPRRPQPVRRPPLPRPRPVKEHDPRTAEIAKKLIEMAGEVPDEIAARWRSGLLQAVPDHGLGWITAECLSEAAGGVSSRSSGALVAALGKPAVAAQIVLVGADGQKPCSRDKLTYGPARARGWPVGQGETVHVTEGVADALAVVAVTGERAVAAVGTGGLKTVPLATVRNPAGIKKLVLVPDGSDKDAIKAAHETAVTAQAVLVAAGVTMKVEVNPRWLPDPAAWWQEHYGHE